MNRRDQFKPENQCRADGCNGEVFSKTISGGDPVFDRRQVGGNRSPLNPLNAGIPASNQQGRMFPEGSRVVSSFCKKRMLCHGDCFGKRYADDLGRYL